MNINYILFWLLLPYFILASSSSFCNHHDTSALLLFKNSFTLNTSLYDNSYSLKTESWKNGTDCCEWDGVTCDTISGHVIDLDLSCSNLQGQLHPNSTIFSLRHLQQLNLAYNDFSGSSLYSAIGDLVNLMHLNLLSSQISGDIPSTISHLSKLLSLQLGGDQRMRVDPYTWNKLIQNATNLRELSLERMDMSSIGDNSLSLLTNLSSSLISLSLFDTELQGNLSSDILSLPNLQILDLSFNKDLGGELPKSNRSTPLSYLDLSDTAFSGNIPDSIAHLESLNTLFLDSCNFDGLIPSSLFNLIQLSIIDLSFNKLVGPIPYWCYSLPSLLWLDLSHNHLTGSIGEFSSYSLEYLILSNNKLQGNFSNSIFELQNLTTLRLSSTDLSGHLDFHQFSKFKNLFDLELSHNSLLSINFDSIADYFLSPNLIYLNLSSCNINSFPKFIAPLQNLLQLDLSHNSIRGSIPQWFHEKLLHSWNNIGYIDLSFNKLQGDLPIPPNGIRYFLVSNNELTGNIPSAMCNASSLYILNLAHNNLTGPIPSAMCNASSLNILNLAQNNLTGHIPQCLGTFPSLWALDLQKNNLYGNIPANFSKGNALETIKLNGNQLDGQLPRCLAQCTNLEVLDLADNNIEDTFPHWLESLQELQVLSLRSNKFHGVITCFGAKHSFPRLRIFDVSNNNFSGPLPASYIKNFQGMVSVNDNQTGLKYMGNQGFYNDSVVVVMKGRYMELERILTIFTTIDLSNNMFEGELLKVIGQLHFLKGLNLSHNAINGTIPRSLGYLRNLEWLDLSWNQLKGEIPVALINLNFLAMLNLSQNQFQGIIPTGGQFNTFENDSYGGNPMLCGFPLSKSCNKDEDWPPHSTFQHAESGFGWKAVAVGFACGLVFGMLLGYNVFMTGKPQSLARLVEGVLN
uniref:Leucine-rich repeat-containing N-terminal plant-type domain-containing protein n=1 Tax=Glycine max TaxID=3847 RepID=A0A0R0GI87_SOYBN